MLWRFKLITAGSRDPLALFPLWQQRSSYVPILTISNKKILQNPLGDDYIYLGLRFLLIPLRARLVLTKLQTDAIHTMPLVRRRRVSFSLKHMAQMSSTVTTDNLNPLHAKRPIYMSRNRSGHRIEICRPATAGFEFGVCLVERCIAGSAIVDAFGGVV